MAYWQIAAGSDGRDYSKYFLKYGVAFVGGDSEETINQIELGDIVVLKSGKTIQAVGKVVQRNGNHRGYQEDENGWMNDIDGWELPAYCYVDWKKAEPPEYNSSLGVARILAIYHKPIIEQADHILDTGIVTEIEPEPSDFKPVDDGEILKGLIKAGLRPSSADELTKAISRIRLLAEYYYHDEHGWGNTREHETRTFLVVPLLLALGWSEQQLKIELPAKGRTRIDIACFKRSYRGDKEDCVAIIETKGFYSGLDYAQNQAKIYAEEFPSCKVVITTNGYCYKIYKRNKDTDEFKPAPHAYMNLLKPKNKYHLEPNIEGTLEAIGSVKNLSHFFLRDDPDPHSCC